VFKWLDDWIGKNEQLVDEAMAAAPNVRPLIFKQLAVAHIFLAVPRSHLHRERVTQHISQIASEKKAVATRSRHLKN
jgi:hypothetical protein